MTEAPQKPGGKGRPTPKRSEAQKARKQPLVGSGRPVARSRSEAAELRKSMREAMRTGDERNYPPIHAGPERAAVRDAVDGRRGFGWVAIPGWVVGFALSITPSPSTRALGTLIFFVIIAVVVTDAVLAARVIRRTLAERWPDGTKESRKALVRYGLGRNTQFRRSRLPRPRVAPGGTPPA